MLFWIRRTYCFLLCLSSNLAGVLPFRNRALGGVSAAESPTVLDGKASIPHPSISLQLFAFRWFEGAERPPVLKPIRRPLGMNLAGVLPFRNRALGGVSAAESPIRSWTAKLLASIPHPSISPQHFALSWFGGADRPISAIVQARLCHVCGLRAGALFFFLGGSKGAVLDPPNVLFFAVPELESCWGSAVSQPCPRRCFCSRISYGAGRQSFYTPSIHLSPTLCY